MKKVLSLVLALALCLSLGVVAFAASATYAPYDGDGDISGDVVSYTWTGEHCDPDARSCPPCYYGLYVLGRHGWQDWRHCG